MTSQDRAAVGIDLEALADLLAERLAPLVAERLRCGGTPRRLLTAREAARELGVSVEHVRRNADRYGAIRLGDGPRARLRFDLDTLAPRPQADVTPSDVPSPKRLRDHVTAEIGDLLPIQAPEVPRDQREAA